MRRIFFSAIAGLVLATAVGLLAQQGVPGTLVQQSPTEMRAATNVSYSRTSAATITITPPGGQFVYITGLDIINCAGTVVTAAAPTFITTTNISGLPQYMLGSNSTAGLCATSATFIQGTGGLKSATAGTAVTFVFPTFVTQQTASMNIYYYFAP